MPSKSKIREIFSGIAAIIICIALIWGFGYLTTHHKNAVEKRFGFCTTTPDMQWVPCHIEPVMVRCVEHGGAFDKAGIKDKDIVVFPRVNSVIAFHRLLDKQKGTVIGLGVISYENFNPDCDIEKWGEQVRKFVIAP
jgi:hypothetical protein